MLVEVSSAAARPASLWEVRASMWAVGASPLAGSPLAGLPLAGSPLAGFRMAAFL
jgi:hypothetical protein